ncbi:TPA: LOW QUALITY PROTEIN: hypothetical protein N0F65_006726 [Lagenidium giganteum]|uniref:DDE-1 domain-containing protein n=1 Tax=Lagenidium giganteum TaxID=4803 RepID=A0AAV2Z3P3_9STRA|nr:TPA: LOW QUALITY PROTEIN: hypothetical protein N0F65_006726 [Lagenidium giganteum]
MVVALAWRHPENPKSPSKWRATRAALKPDRHHNRLAGNPRLEGGLLQWLIQEEAAGIIMTDAAITVKARKLLCAFETTSKLELIKGKFKVRFGLRCRTLHGEADIVDPAVLKSSHNALRHIDNTDETALFYVKTLHQNEVAQRDQKKDRATVLFAVNADGFDKRPALVIGHAVASRTDLHMTLAMQQERPTNITIQFLPKNATSRAQLLDAGIIASFKKSYNHELVSRAIDLDDAGCTKDNLIQLIEAMAWINRIWAKMPHEVIVNCWKHVGILEQNSDHIPKKD